MSSDAEGITILCSHLCVAEGIKPLEPKEWSELAQRLMDKKLRPEFLLGCTEESLITELSLTKEEADRILRLIDRSGSLRFELSKYEDMGIHVITRADSAYPKQLKKKLGNTCPPLFYCCGDVKLLDTPCVGYVGSRTVEQEDIDFTRTIVRTTVRNGYCVVSGGAKGIDSIAAAEAISLGACSIEYLADSMLRKMRDAQVMQHIRDGKLLLISVASPNAPFNVGMAMMRNRFIYAQSAGTVVVRSDKGKGGTWAGATDNLKKRFCPTFCRDCEYPGNKELIRLGAIAINEGWDGNVSVFMPSQPASVQQLSLFD